MRLIGTNARGVRLPIISRGDDLAAIVVDAVLQAAGQERITLKNTDVVGITESVVAKAQGNFASIGQIAADVKNKFHGQSVGLVFPITSRNRFFNILKGISGGAEKVYVLLRYPSDEVGNPIIDASRMDDLEAALSDKPVPAAKFKEASQGFLHPFTNIDYISLYESAGNNVEVYLSDDPRDILKLTKSVLVCEIHSRFLTKARLLKAGAETAYTLSDILSAPVEGSGHNPEYGVLGSNISTEDKLKLFPKDCGAFVNDVRRLFQEKAGVAPEVLVYGDGAFKDPQCGIWELADPVVSPGYTEKLGGQPNEIKLKYIVDNEFGLLDADEKQKAVTQAIRSKSSANAYNDGTTPRKYADLLGSLCDLMSGSGDKGTPVILIQGYFDDYATD